MCGAAVCISIIVTAAGRFWVWIQCLHARGFSCVSSASRFVFCVFISKLTFCDECADFRLCRFICSVYSKSSEIHSYFCGLCLFTWKWRKRLEATSISGPCGLFLSLWCDFKTFKYEWTANSRTWRVIIARSFRKNGFWQKISEQIDVYAAIFEPKRKWNWHLAHVQPTRPVSFARPQCCSAAGTLFSVGSASSQCTDSSSPSSFYRFSIQT